MKISIIILALLTVFVGAVGVTWITMSTKNLGVLELIVGLFVLFIEIFTNWQPWKKV